MYMASAYVSVTNPADRKYATATYKNFNVGRIYKNRKPSVINSFAIYERTNEHLRTKYSQESAYVLAVNGLIVRALCQT